MNVRLRCSILYLALIAGFTTLCQAVPISYHLAQLVARAPIIVAGVVQGTPDAPVFSVHSILKGKLIQKELTITSRSWEGMRLAEINPGEELVLFLEDPSEDGRAALVGGGEESKWPRVPGSGGGRRDPREGIEG